MEEKDEGLLIHEELPFPLRVRMPLLLLSVALLVLLGLRLSARFVPVDYLAYGVSYLGYLLPLCLLCGYRSNARIRVFVPRGQITSVNEMSYKPDQGHVIGGTLECYDDGTGHSIYVFYDDGEVIASA